MPIFESARQSGKIIEFRLQSEFFGLPLHLGPNGVLQFPHYIAELGAKANLLKIFVPSRYTEETSKIGFGLARKLPRFVCRNFPNIGNMGKVATGEPRGFGAVQIPIFEVSSV